MPLKRRYRLPLRVAAFLMAAAVLPLGGCAPLVVGGAAVGATVAAQDRPVKTAISDSVIQGNINAKLLDFDVKVYQRVDIEVVEGRVLLTGIVPDPGNRVDAARLAWQVEGVAEVINEIEVRDTSTLSDAARDSWITTRLRSAILFDPEIQSINYTIDTVNKTVYLMGIAQSQQELDRVVARARQIDYVRRVVPYVRVRGPDPGA